MSTEKPLVGIGACLMGEAVRYSGDSKRKNQHLENMKEHFSFKSLCPEVAIGMGVPRETIRLVGEIDDVRLMDSRSQTLDYTAPMKDYARRIAKQYSDFSGYVLVKGSPSCGGERVKRYNDKGNVQATDGTGLFAAELQAYDPLLPMEEDGRLNDNQLRENFVARVYAYHDWQTVAAAPMTHKTLIDFWSRYKYMVMAHSIGHYKSIGRLLANHEGREFEDIREQFIQLLMDALSCLASRKSNTNVLEHVRGYLKKQMNTDEKRELSGIIGQYREGFIPLIVPVTLLRHYFNRYQNAYINQQVFFSPYPEQLSLRNGI